MRSLTAQILVGMVAGALLGVFAPDAWQVVYVGGLGKAIITLIKTFATPLLFLTILSSLLKTEIRWSGAKHLFLFAGLNSLMAICIGLGLSNLFQPGQHLSVAALSSEIGLPTVQVPTPKVGVGQSLIAMVPESIVQPFAENQVVTLVVIALLLGFAIRRLEGGARKALEGPIAAAQEATAILISWVVRLVPVAVFAVVTSAVAQYGFKPLRGLLIYVAVGLLGLTLQSVVYQLWIRFYARIPLRKFWKEAKDPTVYALGANSSLATLPLTLTALDRLKISSSASTLGACVGTNLNQDGIILYEAMAALLVAQAAGLHLDLSQQLVIAVTSLLAAAGIAGIPEAGFISLAVVLSAVGVPTEMLPLLLTVDWVIARGRSVVNVLSDLTLSILIDRADT